MVVEGLNGFGKFWRSRKVVGWPVLRDDRHHN